ncbi:hypothetical protein BDV37DRAFT_280413 [Aspergillus pseudonomiae]|uniref:BZIP domain-containing protein n=1 Tax=Aspergillus pseudonomiae TaxID=1506151 RepID=A0A5N7DLE3_9EURO|nr:uncharacterized protein BDV37DRAFT_280413 [Aspergillus pseudonomiae]KAE8406803.1 hypothetical protein BDV37DRAFT_280413 [Aspergillus pseudonomiae]
MSENNHHAPADTIISSCLTPDSQPQPQQENASTKTARIPSRKRGRPRKVIEAWLEKNKKERRRTQVRLAQRAYRSRKEAGVEVLNKRVAQLEAAAQKMSESVIKLSDILLQSRVLTSHPELTERLRETVQICLSSAKDLGDEGSLNNVTHDERSSFAPISPSLLDQSEGGSPGPLPNIRPSPSLLRYHPSSLFFFKPGDVTVMEVSDFIEQLRIACLYEGLLILDNSSVPLTTLKRPFRLLLSLFTRASITSVFRSALHARLNKKSYMSFKEVPSCLSSHLEQLSALNQTTECQSALDQPQSISNSPLPNFDPQTLREIGGDWFDVQELANYLQEREARLFVRPPKNMGNSSSQSVVNARALIVTLVSNAMCLGHSPGFRRSDVEQAIKICTWRGTV